MRYKRIIAGALCIALVCSTGCSLGKKSSSNSGSTDYSYSSTSKKEYKFSDFSFELSEDFSVKDTDEKSSGATTKYEFSGGSFKTFEVYNYSFSNCTAEVSAQDLYDSLKNEKSESVKHSDIELEKLDIPGMSAACVHVDSDYTDKGVKQTESDLYISTEAHYFIVTLTYEDAGDRAKVKGLLKDIAESVKYTSSDKLPTEQQTFDCDYMTISYAPEWFVRESGGNNKETDTITIKAEYAYATDKEHTYFPNISINVRPEDEENTPELLADKAKENKKKSSLAKNVERTTGELLGYKTEVCSFTLDTGSISGHYIMHFFADNGYVYGIATAVHTSAAESNTADVEKFLEGVTIKKLTAEELEKKKQEREAAKYTEQTMANAVFSLDSKFKAGSTNGKYDSRFSNSADDMYLYICRKTDIDYDGAFKEYIEKKCSMISYFNDLDGVYSKKVILGDKNFEDIFYTEKAESGEEPKKHSIYLFDRGDEIWEFDMSYNEKDEEKAVGYLEEMLWTLKFDN
ncbi:MAG: hypothetical protein IKO47_08120 [Ruminococcus sp.]|nr:hypothetical protein [Ruminococcus sp.]